MQARCRLGASSVHLGDSALGDSPKLFFPQIGIGDSPPFPKNGKGGLSLIPISLIPIGGEIVSIFGNRAGRKPAKRAGEALPAFPPDQFEPVIRSSICTGEQVACMQEKETGQLHEVMLIRNAADLEAFCSAYGADAGTVRKVY